MTSKWVIGWTAFVAGLWVLASLGSDDPPQCDGFICLTLSDVLLILLIPAVILWALGLLVLFIAFRVRSHLSSRRPAPHGHE